MGAGGNAGAVMFGFLFRIESMATADALMIIGYLDQLGEVLFATSV